MDTPELKDPYTWTPAFVRSHRAQCLPRIREVNQLVITAVQGGEYVRAAVLAECVAEGLYTMDKALPEDYRPFVFSYAVIRGILALNVDPIDTCEGMGFSMVDSQGRMANLRELNRKSGNQFSRQSMAINFFKYAHSIAQTPRAKQEMAEAIRSLERGEDCDDITPEDALFFLRDLDDRLARAIAGDRTANRSRASARKKGRRPVDFDDWMEMNDWDEEDLAIALKRVKLRRNLYGVLLLVPGLGILLLPFWLRALWLTRALRSRDIDVGFRFFENVVAALLGLPTLFIYPIVMGWIIRWSNWGMGLEDPRGSVLNTLFWGSIALFLLWRLAASIGPIPFVAGAVLLVLFLVIRLCKRLGSPVPALVFGGLSVVALVALLAFGRADIAAIPRGADLSGWLSTLPERVLNRQSGGESDAPDQAAMARAMLEVLDQAMVDHDFGEAGLADVDGDGAKELLVACEPYALLYSWQDGQLTVKEVGALAGGYFLWYLCQDTETGQHGLQFECGGGGDFDGGDTTYYYSSHQACVGERRYFDDNGAVSGEFYYIEGHEVPRVDYLSARKQHRTLGIFPTESWYERGVQTTVTRAELEAVRDGGTLQDISDEGLLALARTAVYALPSMYFSLDTGGMIPQDRYDSIVVNMGHDGFGQVHAYRALDCATAEEVEAAVRDAWHQAVSRRYPVDYEAHVIEYTGQAGDYNAGDLLRYNGAIYVVENYGLGDGGSERAVDRMISRTTDEAVFQVYDDFGEYSISLIYEDGIWKYGNW